MVIGELQRRGVASGVTVTPGGNGFFAYPFLLRRSMVFGTDSMDAFRAKLVTFVPVGNAVTPRCAPRFALVTSPVRAGARRRAARSCAAAEATGVPPPMSAARSDVDRAIEQRIALARQQLGDAGDLAARRRSSGRS